MDTEPAPFTVELFQLLGIIKPPEVVQANMVTPLNPWLRNEKVIQRRREVRHPGHIFKRGTKWVFKITYRGNRIQKGGFETELAARHDMQRWLTAQKVLYAGKV